SDLTRQPEHGPHPIPLSHVEHRQVENHLTPVVEVSAGHLPVTAGQIGVADPSGREPFESFGVLDNHAGADADRLAAVGDLPVDHDAIRSANAASRASACASVVAALIVTSTGGRLVRSDRS